MNLVVDAGNTRMKYAFFEDGHFVEAKYQSDELLADIHRWKATGAKIDLLLSGSGKIPEDIRISLKELSDSCIEASPLMKLPLKISYATPATLGIDRVAICVGAMLIFPECPLLVIDSGTCITFNYVNVEGLFLGGNISPGLEMRFRGLHQFTARLPEVSPTEEYGGIGQTTEQAIRNGVMDGMLFEIEMYMQHFLSENKNGRVVITGGNSHFLEKYLKKEGHFCGILGFMGLNEILEYAKKFN